MGASADELVAPVEVGPARLWLIGMMGSGKTRVGSELASRTGLAFLDTDTMVEARLGQPIAELWSDTGEDAFRRAEAEAVVEAAQRPPAVVATGGGVVLSDPNIDTMRATGLVVWLDASPLTLAQRVGTDRARPLLAGTATPETVLREILGQRRHRYRRAAHARVSSEGRKVIDVVEEVMSEWIVT